MENDQLQNVPAEHIGAAPHPRLNLLLCGAVLASAGLISVFYFRAAKSDETALAELQGFRQAMAAQCKQASFARPLPKGLDSLYADSSRMQAVIHEQYGSLQRGQGNCDQILWSLKIVDFLVD